MTQKYNDIAIIGGRGFIGASLANYLSEVHKCKVVVIDNLFNPSRIILNKNIKVITGDIDSFVKINQNKRAFDCVFHFGEYARVEKSLTEFDRVLDLNRTKFHRLLSVCLNKKIKLIYAGSSTKFGDQGLNKFETPYAFSKYQNTELLVNFSRWYDLNYAIAYFYNVYGPGESDDEDYGTVIARFRKKYLNGDSELPVVSSGEQRRNFTHIHDILDALYLIMLDGRGDNYGISSEKSYTILEIVKAFKCKPKFVGERSGNRLDSEVIMGNTQKLGWTASRDVMHYIREIVKMG